jgi:hypothetical protein
VMQLNNDRRERPEILRTVLEHKGSVVTALCWSTDGKNLFIGDEQGVVNGVPFAASKVAMLLYCICQVLQFFSNILKHCDAKLTCDRQTLSDFNFENFLLIF